MTLGAPSSTCTKMPIFHQDSIYKPIWQWSAVVGVDSCFSHGSSSCASLENPCPPFFFTKQKFLPRSQAPLVRLVPSSTKNPVIVQFVVSRADFPDSMDPSHHCSAWFHPFFHVSSENIPIVPISHTFLQYSPISFVVKWSPIFLPSIFPNHSKYGGVLSHRATPSSHRYHPFSLDFPWNKPTNQPTSYLGIIPCFQVRIFHETSWSLLQGTSTKLHRSRS